MEKFGTLKTIQKRNKLNEIVRTDEKGPGGAHHSYMVERYVYPVGEPEHVIPVTEIVFQKGARDEEGSTTGVLDCDLLEIVRDRLSDFQNGEYATKENENALHHIEEALLWLNKRVEDRADRGVLGTMNK